MRLQNRVGFEGENAKQYMLMCCFDEKRWEKIPEPQRDGIMQEYGEFVQGLVRSGYYLAGEKLQSTSTATTVSGKNGKPAITHGPFAKPRSSSVTTS